MGEPEGAAGPLRRLIASDAVAPGQVVEVTIDGTGGELDLVVWRTASGAPCVMEARCPHNWSHLGAEGAVDGEEIVCCTHYWRFDTAGVGTKLNVNGRRDPKADIAVFACAEIDGTIILLSGDPAAPE
ncbi:MAG: Rieske 2Fe-2S domain-containing protein [Acidimicrobiales bacterium]|nr:Rieske 2Fe-2S domain-containing protein [Acidimicrobiales bacterium]